MTNTAKSILFLSILTLGIFLRLNGITWGLPIDLPHTPLHPDEAWAMQVLSQVQIDQGDFNPEEGHREGTLAYFIWSGAAFALKQLGIISQTPFSGQAYDQDYAKTLLTGRILTVIFDLFSALFIFKTLTFCTRHFLSALFGMFIFLIIPYEVIHAHFMRTHIVANFFLTAVIYFSFKLYTKKSILDFFLIGLTAGLGIATRYPTGSILLVPALTYLGSLRSQAAYLFTDLKQIFKIFVNFKLSSVALGLIVGFIIGLPFLIFDFASAKPHLIQQANYIATEEFSLLTLLKLDRLASYITYLIPYGSLPFLWVLFYGSIAYLLAYRISLKYVIPLLVFIVVYLYLMGKGYFSAPIFIRAIIPLFPPFALCAGFAFHGLISHTTSKPLRFVIGAILSVLTIPSILYGVAYTNAMKHDPRVALAHFLNSTWHNPSLRIGLYNHGHNYFTVMPTLNVLPNTKVAYVQRDSFAKGNNHDIDFLILSAFEHSDYKNFYARRNWLKHNKKFAKIQTFVRPITLFGYEFNFKKPPHDLLYPFPTIELWQRVKK